MDAAQQLAALEPRCRADEALALFDSLPAVRPTQLLGRWRGRELATGHPFDGLLTASGWYGKQFDGSESVHPLLFCDAAGNVFAVDPRRVPFALAGRVSPALVARTRPLVERFRPALQARGHRARLRDLQYRGVVAAAMVYDHLPIIDAFRRVDDDTLLGAMDLRDVPQPFMFVLQRD